MTQQPEGSISDGASTSFLPILTVGWPAGTRVSWSFGPWIILKSPVSPMGRVGKPKTVIWPSLRSTAHSAVIVSMADLSDAGSFTSCKKLFPSASSEVSPSSCIKKKKKVYKMIRSLSCLVTLSYSLSYSIKEIVRSGFFHIFFSTFCIFSTPKQMLQKK